jgi:hypothetical protein
VYTTAPELSLEAVAGNPQNKLNNLLESDCVREDAIATGVLMLDGKRYFASFPDEDGTTRRLGLHSAELLQTLAALEKEFRAVLQEAGAAPAENELDHGA